jgi:hypothetical protein
VLNLRACVTRSAQCQRDVRDRLFRFYDWCAANDDIPELLTLARTIARWEDELVRAVLTGVTNARSELEPDRQAGGTPGIFLPQPREPATPGPHGLHPGHPAITEFPQPPVTPGHQPETRPRLTRRAPNDQQTGSQDQPNTPTAPAPITTQPRPSSRPATPTPAEYCSYAGPVRLPRMAELEWPTNCGSPCIRRAWQLLGRDRGLTFFTRRRGHHE